MSKRAKHFANRVIGVRARGTNRTKERRLLDITKEITYALYDNGMIRTWYRDKPEGWTLVSGMWSPFYIQLRSLCSYPTVLQQIGKAMTMLLRKRCPSATRLVGLAMAGIPVAIVTSLESRIPAAFTRKLNATQNYGEHHLIEGELIDNDDIVILDDVVTRFDSKLKAIGQIEQEVGRRGLRNVRCSNIAVVLNREQGAADVASSLDLHLHSLIKFKTQALKWLRDRMSPLELEVISDYLENPNEYQSRSKQRRILKQATDKVR